MFRTWCIAAKRPADPVAAALQRSSAVSRSGPSRRAAVDQLCVPGGHPYMSAYYYGWRLLEPWLTRADRHTKARRVLTEQLLPVDLVSPGG